MVWILTSESEDGYQIVIKDDVVGFDTNKEINVSKHISLKIDSEIGMRTICEVVIPG